MNRKEQLLKDWNDGVFRGSQRKLAEVLKINESAVSMWLAGKNTPSEENIKKMAALFRKPEEEITDIFNSPAAPPQTHDYVDINSAQALIKDNTLRLPILAGVPAGLPEYSNRDVSTFWDIPRWIFPGADFVVECIGDSLEPKIERGDYCVVREETTPIFGKPMLVKTENGFTMKILCKDKDGQIMLCSSNPKYEPIRPRELKIIGIVIGHWSRDDRENWTHNLP
ncbi:repressor LexA [Elusimicrobium posterum]|uniref:LexA family protein n=1 Tax=Elusimicrobium posterum TaxID=3116653 RepID=UPI003C75A5C4